MSDTQRTTEQLKVEGVTLSFGGVKALSDVSFSVKAGSISALIGPNGAGKTSMFNCISGFYQPSAGKILLDGQDISRMRPPGRAKLGMARSFQNIARHCNVNWSATGLCDLAV